MKSDSTRGAWVTQWQVGLALLVLLASLLWVSNAIFRDPRVPFLTGVDDPTWITPWQPIDTNAIRVDPSRIPVYTFTQHFSLGEQAGGARLRMRAVGGASLRIDDRLLWESRPGRSWKRSVELEVGEALPPGSHEIRVRVANERGPALLQLRIEDEDGEALLETGPSWRVVGPGGRRLEAVRARDTRPAPESFSLPSTGRVLVDEAAALGLLFAVGAGLHLVLSRSRDGRRLARAPELLLAAATVFWVAVYAAKSSRLPVLMGFDIVGHLAYVDFLIERRALPLATDGWSMYHPPLGHATIAGWVALFDLAREDAAARWLYRLPTFLAGLANVWAAAFTARRLFPGSTLRASLAVGFAALLPMNLYMSAYVSNEPLHSALVSAALCIACGLLCGPGAPTGRLAALAGCLGLAILTKFTALMAVPLVVFFVAAKRWLVDRASAPRAAGVAGALLLGVAAIGGWFYLRSWLRLGRPVVGNWDLPGDRVWWEQPGFHTLDYYTSFGQSLSHPFFAGYASFWDGLYSTFWGDGLAAGMVQLATRHDAWRYDWMTAVYWLAFPATVLLFVGAVRALRRGLRGSDLGRRLAFCLLLSFAYCAGFALFTITLQLPFYAQAKAFYVLSAIVPLSVFAGLGLSWPLEAIPDRAWPLQTLYVGWLCTLVGSIAMAFLG